MSNEVPEFKNEDVKEKLEGMYTHLVPTHISNQTFTDSVAAQVKSVDMVFTF